jgi:hypothetical protein
MIHNYIQAYEVGWPWVDRRGYAPDFQKSSDKIPSHFQLDPTLFSNRYQAGRLLGYLSPQEDFDKTLDSCKDWKFAKSMIKDELVIDFSNDSVTVPKNLKQNMYLFLVVNDSVCKVWQYDNFGNFMVILRKI